jgi:hypothetical protein
MTKRSVQHHDSPSVDAGRYGAPSEWGAVGLDALAPADVVIVVDVLSFSTCVDIALSRRLDLRPFAVTRSDERAVKPDGIVLPGGRLNVTILLPVGSEPGAYEIQVLDADLQARASAKETAAIRDYVTTVRRQNLIASPAG